MSDFTLNAPIDSLPYYDRDLDDNPSLGPQINSLIAVELRSLLPAKPSSNPANLSHLAPARPLPTSTTHSPLLANELARVQAKKPIQPGQGLDTTRYAMPFPPADEQDDLEAWERAHESSLAQLEHQRLRSINGTLLQQFGANSWRVQNFAVENAIKRTEQEAEQVKQTAEDVNRRRKADQEVGGQTLNRLEKRWTELVSGNMQLEIGCFALEEQLAELEQRHAAVRQRLQAA
ncbi:pre-mRNA-splicing factor SPF27 family protein [Sporobolomyces koalae]|uniref:pre-mRNA-splicing factor SPF27 family protein n=1 Tax=Sporobolomyces koalae TaxID=500713 RepID=UPI003182255E